MEWRCEWCGKPHEGDDPPCDSCGHHKFERAVVQVGGEDPDRERGPVWACTECDREHQKYAPPCSRCGNAQLEKRQPDYGDVESATESGWLDVLERKHAAGFAVAGVLVTVLALGGAGVLDLPGVGGPSMPEAPGEPETAAGLDLEATADEYVTAFNDERDDAGLAPATRSDALERMATYYNRKRVDAEYGDGESPSGTDLDRFDPDCRGSNALYIVPRTLPLGSLQVASLDTYPNESAFGSSLVAVDSYSVGDGGSSTTLWERESVDRIGADIHVAPDDTVFMTVLAC